MTNPPQEFLNDWSALGTTTPTQGIRLCGQDEKECSKNEETRKTLNIECLQKAAFYFYLLKAQSSYIVLNCSPDIKSISYSKYLSILPGSKSSGSCYCTIQREQRRFSNFLTLDQCKLQNGSQSFREHLKVLVFQEASMSKRKCILDRGILHHPSQQQSNMSLWRTGPIRRGWIESQFSGTWQQVEAPWVPISWSCLQTLAAQWQLFNVCWFFIKD